MIISDYAITRRTTVFVLMFIIAVAGIYAYLTLPREATPDVTIPYILVVTANRGVGPSDIENTITTPLETELEGLDDVKKMTSISSEGASMVIIEFEASVDIDDALRKVKDRVDRAKGDLPSEATQPSVQEINISEFPIVIVNIFGQADPDRQRNLMILRKIADELKDRFESIPGVLDVKRAGGLTPEVRIEIDPDRLSAYRIPASLLVARYMGEDVKISAGSSDFGAQSFDIRVPMEFERDIESAKNIIIHKDGERAVYLGDLADIVPGYEKEDTRSRFNGQDSISLAILKKSGENIIYTVGGVKYIIDRVMESGQIPAGVKIALTQDHSDFIQKLVDDLDNNIYTGFFLVIAVVLVAMGARNSFFVGIAIPFSLLLTLAVLSIAGITLNFVVLFSLILALGMLVDNAIVIVENIYRHQQIGFGRVEAALKGTAEVAWPITTSTLTTLAAFFPLLFWPGIMGEFMSYLPITVIISLSASLFVALVINPAACAAFLKVPKKRIWGGGPRPLHPVLKAYQRILRSALRWKWSVTVLAFGALFGVAMLWGANARMQFMPDAEPQQAFVDLSMPEGTLLEKTDERIKFLEKGITETEGSADIKATTASIGSRGAGGLISAGTASNIGRISLEFKDIALRQGNTSDLIERIRARFSEVAGCEIRVQAEEMGPPSGAPVNIEIAGEDYDLLGEIAAKVTRVVREIPGVVDLRDDYEPGRPELKVMVDRKRAAMLGLSPLMTGLTVQTAYRGTKVGVVRVSEEEYDVKVIAPEKHRTGFGMLDKLYLATETGSLVPASSVADWEITGGLGVIRRIDRSKVVSISSDVAKGFNTEFVRRDVQKALNERISGELPRGYTIKLTGEQEMMVEAQQFLGKAFVIGILLITLILIAQFNSLRLPIIVMSSVVLSTGAVFLQLIVLDMPFGVVMTGIGVISLAGVVVNNAIVLIDYMTKLRERGMPAFEAVVEAGTTRLRPVLLTAITTVIGLFPMAFGFSVDFKKMALASGKEMSQWWGGMAWAVIFGLGLATLLTLVVVPTLYCILMRVDTRTEREKDSTGPLDDASMV